MAQHPRVLTLMERIEAYNVEWRNKNSHCFYFGVYSFNLTKWNSLNPSETRIWCNSTAHVSPLPRKFLTGFIKHSNLIMLVVEDEAELIHCGNMSQLVELYYPKPKKVQKQPEILNLTSDLLLQAVPTLLEEENNIDSNVYSDTTWLASNETNSSSENAPAEKAVNSYFVNRYRKKPESCYNFFDKEKEYLPCSNVSIVQRAHALYVYLFCFLGFFFLTNLLDF